jgi:hypothetical protein
MRDTFVGMDVEAVPAETVIAGTLDDDEELYRLLVLIQSLGLHVVAVDQVAVDQMASESRPPPPGRGGNHGTSASDSPPG